MTHHYTRSAVPVLAASLAWATLLAEPVLAQQRQAPPTPPATDGPGAAVFLYYAVIVLLGGATIAVSVMPGKRGHQE